MKVLDTKQDIESYISETKRLKKSIGFVPTMGALHRGHLSLLAAAKKQNDIVVCSIFVNPTQFNNKEDLAKYPRTLEKDIELLQTNGCDVLFCPAEKEIYPNGTEKNDFTFDFGNLENVMEGTFRPGHFQGVATVVKILFDLVKPDNAYFGEKDFQQVAIIQKMIKDCNYQINIVSCPIVREGNGLAMSSRNERLSAQERSEAAIIFKTLQEAKQLSKTAAVAEIKKYVSSVFEKQQNMQLDYFEICNSDTLQPIKFIDKTIQIRAFIAVYLATVRLIDNVAF